MGNCPDRAVTTVQLLVGTDRTQICTYFHGLLYNFSIVIKKYVVLYKYEFLNR